MENAVTKWNKNSNLTFGWSSKLLEMSLKRDCPLIKRILTQLKYPEKCSPSSRAIDPVYKDKVTALQNTFFFNTLCYKPDIPTEIKTATPITFRILRVVFMYNALLFFYNVVSHMM